MHQIECRIDLLQRESMRNELVDENLLVQVHLDQLRHRVQRFVTAERRALPRSAGDELERPGAAKEREKENNKN